MNVNVSLADNRPHDVLQDLIDRHGRLPIFGLALAALLRRRRVPLLDVQQLSPHLQRDIGYQPHSPSKGWELYR